MITVKDALKPVPQPYKTYLGRAALVVGIPVLVPFAAVVEGADWCKEMYGEIVDAWHGVKEW